MSRVRIFQHGRKSGYGPHPSPPKAVTPSQTLVVNNLGRHKCRHKPVTITVTKSDLCRSNICLIKQPLCDDEVLVTHADSPQ